MTLDIQDSKIKQMVDSQVKWIRRMAMLPDETIKILLTKQLIEQPHLIDNYDQEEQKKMFHDMKKAAVDVKANPIKFARKVDGGIKLQ
jgi:hypothetical protein